MFFTLRLIHFCNLAYQYKNLYIETIFLKKGLDLTTFVFVTFEYVIYMSYESTRTIELSFTVNHADKKAIVPFMI